MLRVLCIAQFAWIRGARVLWVVRMWAESVADGGESGDLLGRVGGSRVEGRGV